MKKMDIFAIFRAEAIFQCITDRTIPHKEFSPNKTCIVHFDMHTKPASELAHSSLPRSMLPIENADLFSIICSI